MRKDGQTKNTVADIGISLSHLYQSQYEENRRQEGDFMGRCSRLRSSHFNNSGESPRKMGTLGRSSAERKRHQTSGQMVEDPMTRADTPKEIGR